MKISPVKYNMIFSARHRNNIEKNSQSKNKELVHTSHFFRYDKNHLANQAIGEFLKRNCKSEPINVVSMGCSYGEEVYSLAMTLDYFNLDSKIKGFDISKQALNGIQEGIYRLSGYETEYLCPNLCHYEVNDNPSEFQKGMRKEFSKNFELLDEWDKKFKVKEGAFQNCEFFQGDVTQLGKYFEKESQDLINCSFVLYHLDDKDKLKTIKQIYEVLKPGGILCLAPLEHEPTLELKIFGFIQPNLKYPWIYQKPKKTGLFGNYLPFNLLEKNKKIYENIEQKQY